MGTYDVLVVGAGPAGAATAKLIAEKGFSVLVVDSRKKPGTPQQCSGLFSRNILDETSLKKQEVLMEIKGATIHSPSMESLEIRANDTQAYVVDRTVFDARLADEAKGAGAEILTGTRFKGYENNKAFFSSAKPVSARIIVGADGVNSEVAKIFGFPEIGKKVFGAINLYDKKPETDLVELYLGNKIAPGFFAWTIPRKDDVEFGIASSGRTRLFFERFLKMNGVRQKPKTITGGAIPLKPRKKTVSGNCILVGDAAGHAKATTGGGVVMALRAAKAAAYSVCSALEQDSISILGSYEQGWRKEIGKDLKYAWMIRRFLDRLDDRELDNLIRITSRKEMKEFLLKNGDMDYPSRMLRAGIRKPRMLLPYLRFVPRIIKSAVF